MAPARIKGAVVREFVRWYVKRLPPAGVQAIWDELPEGARRVLDEHAEALGLLPSMWYDAAVVHALIEAMLRDVPQDQRDAVLRAGTRAGIEASARGIYRWVVSNLTPQLYARNIQRFWSLVHDTGERKIVMTSPTTAVSTTRAWAGHHPDLCTTTIEAMCAMLEMTGCRDVHAERVQCVSEGAPACVAHVRWTR